MVNIFNSQFQDGGQTDLAYPALFDTKDKLTKKMRHGAGSPILSVLLVGSTFTLIKILPKLVFTVDNIMLHLASVLDFCLMCVKVVF